MGINVHDVFGAFDKRLALPEARRGEAMIRMFRCVSALDTKFYPDQEGAVDRVSLLGSVSKRTAIDPLVDIDVLYHMPPGTYHRFEVYSSNGQSALLQEVRDVLTRRFPRTTIRGDGPVVVVDFQSGATVEIVPGVLLREANILGAQAFVPVTTRGGRWEFADYTAEWSTLDLADKRSGGQFRRLIRYAKAWRLASKCPIESVYLELAAQDFMRTWDTSQSSFTWDDWLIRDFLEYLATHAGQSLALPGSGKQIEAGNAWHRAATASCRDAQEACRHADAGLLYVHYWRKVLGDRFAA